MNQTPTRLLLPVLVPVILSLSLSLSACGRASAPNDPASTFTATPDASAGMSGADGMGGINPDPGPQQRQASNDAGNAPAASDGMQRVQIIDRNGFGAPMPAMSIELPAGWPVQGGITWNAQARCGNTPSYEWRASSPDGTKVVEMTPTEVWQFNNLPPMQGIEPPCPTLRIDNVRDYLQSFVQRKRPGARILDYRARPDLIRFPPPASTADTRYWKESGEMLIAYTVNGVEMREDIGAIVQLSRMTLAGVGPGDTRVFINGYSLPMLSVRAPEGQLDMSLLPRIGLSARTDPQWQARMDEYNTRLARQGVKAQQQRGDIATQTRNDIADINQRGWQDRQDSNDGIHRATIDGINNVDRYQDPVTGGEVQLDNRYDHAWRAGDGTYIQSNDPNLNQQGALGTDAEEMERSR